MASSLIPRQRYLQAGLVRNQNGTITDLGLQDSVSDTFLIYNYGYQGPRTKPLGKHPLTWTKTYFTRFSGFAEGRRTVEGGGSSFTNWTGQLSGSTVQTGVLVNDLALVYESALTKLYEDHRGQIDLSIDLYQVRQTATLVKQIANAAKYLQAWNVPLLVKSAILYADKIRKGKKRRPLVSDGERVWELYGEKANVLKRTPRVLIPRGTSPGAGWRKVTKDAGQLWLAYSYGLKPTVQTVFDAASELTRNIEPLLKLEAKRSMKRVGTDVNTNFAVSSIGGCRYYANYSQETRCKIVCTFKHSASSIQLLSRFSSVNPAGFIWENLPFSFVFDWFLDVGGYLRNLESSVLASNVFVDGSVTYSIKRVVNATVTKSSYNRFFNGAQWLIDQDTVSCEAAYKQTYMDRTILVSAPVPKTPRFKVDFSSPLRALNAISLLAQFWSRK